MDSVEGNRDNDMIFSCTNRLDESNQSSASTVMSNDSIDEKEDYVVQKTLMLHDLDDNESFCSVDDVCNVKNRIPVNSVNDIDDVKLSNDFLVQANSISTVSTLDVSETIASVPTEPICGVNLDATTGGEVEIHGYDGTSMDDDVKNHELALYYSDEKHQPEIGSTEPSAPSLRNLSLLDQLDIMFEKLCFTNTAVRDDLVMTYACPPNTQMKPLTGPYSNNDYLSSMDTILAILGCNSASTTNEYDYFASLVSLLSCCGGDSSKSDTTSAAHSSNQNESITPWSH
jgi:hypothetical protein